MRREDIDYLFKRMNGKSPITSGNGGWVMVNCLFGANHSNNDRSKSAAISVDDEHASYYTCHGCGKKGFLMSIILDYIVNYHPYSKKHLELYKQYMARESCHKLDWKNRGQQNTIRTVKYMNYNEEYKTLKNIDDYWIDFLKNKGINSIDIMHNNFKQYNNDLIIPFYNHNGDCIGAKRRRKIYDHKFKKYYYHYPIQSHELLYPEWIYPIGKPIDTLILVEGELDAWHFIDMGYDCLSILGTHLSYEKRDRLYRRYDPFNILIIMDNDKAGRQGALKIAKLIEQECFVKIVDFNKNPRTITKKEINNVKRKTKERK